MAPISLIIDYITSHLIPGSRTHGCINTAVLYINTTHVQPRPLLGAGQTGVWLYWGRSRQVGGADRCVAPTGGGADRSPPPTGGGADSGAGSG